MQKECMAMFATLGEIENCQYKAIKPLDFMKNRIFFSI